MSSSVYRVRCVEPSDYDDLVAVWRSTWTATYTASLGTMAVDAMLRDLEEHGAANLIPDGTRALCLVHQGSIVGTAVHSQDGSIIYLWGMYVLPAHQRLGAGALLLQAVRDAAGERPIEIRVLQSSPHAHSFYRKHGFRTVGQEKTDIIPSVQKVCWVMRQTA